MATTYFDAYTIIDVVNTQATDSALNNSNEATGTFRPSSYDSTSNPTGGAVLNTGYSQKSLYELLMEIQVNWDEAMVALDAEVGVGTTTYTADCSIAENSEDAGLNGAYSADVIAALLTLGIPNVGKINIYRNGMGTKEVAILCQAIASMIAKATALLDADTGLTDTNYASTRDIDFVAPAAAQVNATGGISVTSSATPFNIAATESYIKTTGIKQGALVTFLQQVVTNLNAIWVKIDADLTP